MPLVRLDVRSAAQDSSTINPIYITGFAAVGATVLGLVIWLLLRTVQKRAADRREEEPGAAFLSVRGVMRDGKTISEKRPGLYAIPNTTFSRRYIDESRIVMPEKAVIRQCEQVDKEISRQLEHIGSPALPFSLSSLPFVSTTTSGPTPSSPAEGDVNDHVSQRRDSHFSTASVHNRFSVMSAGSSAAEHNPSAGRKRKVQQLFNPVMPDELFLSTAGEPLTVIQSYDDGWCLIARERGISGPTAKSIFGQNSIPGDNIEIGVVPAWCFIRSVKGLRVERPIRRSSLGISVQLQGHAFLSRDQVISWSNF
ncbi:hypothetical protein AX17_007346 [Amanita inopinata Kibby_2008]|nr:hypothetical protein AX17_007346 [Amanita inopinata Kibby_2008]